MTVIMWALLSDKPVKVDGITGLVMVCLLFLFLLASLNAFQFRRNCLVKSFISLPSRTAAR